MTMEETRMNNMKTLGAVLADFNPPCTYENEVLQTKTEAMERSIDNE